jgi:D-aminopeptidase
VIGTDAPLLPIQLRRVAKRATLGIARTGTSGDNDSGDLFLAFSVANDIGAVPASQPQPAFHSLEFIDDAHCDLVYQATVQAVEEAVINAMLAARDMSSVKPPGRTFEAIDAEALRAVMRKYGRLIG